MLIKSIVIFRSSNKGKKKKLDVENAPSQFKKLRTLDVFAGCGGLSEGFHQVKVSLNIPLEQTNIFSGPRCLLIFPRTNNMFSRGSVICPNVRRPK